MNRMLWSELDERTIKPLLDIGREAYSDVYVFVHGEDDNHYDALDAAIMAVLAAAPARPARGVVDEDVVIQAERAFWPAYNEALRVHGTKADCHVIGMRAALQAAALPAVPKADEVDVDAVMAIIDKWMIYYDHIGTGSTRLGQISEREWEEDRAKLLELLAATPAHDQPEGSDND